MIKQRLNRLNKDVRKGFTDILETKSLRELSRRDKTIKKVITQFIIVNVQGWYINEFLIQNGEFLIQNCGE